MAHPDPKVSQGKRLMARPVRGGKVGAFLASSLGGGHASVSARGELRQRRRDLAVVAALLLVVALVSIALPGGWVGSSSPSSSGRESGLTAALGSTFPTPAASSAATSSESASDAASASGSSAAASAGATASSAPASHSPTPAPGSVKFVTLGDSLTVWPTTGPWPSRLDAEDSTLVLAHNAGVAGNTTAQMLARFSKDVTHYKPQVLFVLGGTNDLGHGVPQATIIANLRSIILTARAQKIRVFMMTVPPQTKPSSAITSLNRAIIHLANSYQIVVVDIYTVLATTSGAYQSKYTSDGLHFNDLGAQTVANAVYSRVRRLGY
jgi:lysophospholipase L1-like esterase